MAETEAIVEPPGAGPEENAATAVPLRGTVCCKPWTSSENTKLAVRCPGAIGLKTTEIVQLDVGVSVAGQLLVKLKSEGFGPAREMPEMCKDVFPVLITVRVCGLLEVPSVVAARGGEGNESVGGEKLIAGKGVRPVPLRTRV